MDEDVRLNYEGMAELGQSRNSEGHSMVCDGERVAAVGRAVSQIAVILAGLDKAYGHKALQQALSDLKRLA